MQINSIQDIFVPLVYFSCTLPGDEVVDCLSQDQKYGGFESPMTHQNICNHNLIQNVALGIYDYES